LAEGPVLPARFGTVLPSIDRLRAELEERGEELAEALEFVRGRVELGVRAAWPESTVADEAPESGRAYLTRKLEQQRAAADAAAALHEPLAGIAVANTVEIEHEPCLALVGSYLVERDDVARFRDEVDRLANSLDGIRLACTGPWPPYTFADRRSAA
jgi:Gas vesicle synthesis protein GvpL/GvpF